MSINRDFAKSIGTVNIPVADTVSVTEHETGVAAQTANASALAVPTPVPPVQFKICKTILKEGCYTFTYVPNGTPIFGTRYHGTVRVENMALGGIRFSGDLYSFSLVITPRPPFSTHPAGSVSPLAVSDRVDRIRMSAFNRSAGGAAPDSPGVIPIYPRKNYYSYLKGTSAELSNIVPIQSPCWFGLNFDEFKYTHPATGFSGTFPAAATRSLRCVFNPTATPDSYSGTLYQGTTALGAISMEWISPRFRRATLSIYRLVGAENPPASVPKAGGGTEDFGSVFNSVNWDLSFSFVGDIPLPPALVGVQDPNQCWSMPNYATLMSSIPGYDPNVLDTNWRAYLMAVPAKLGCSRGFMFDTGAGNPNNIAREGAATQTHDGYPAADSPHFGVAQDKMQKDFPRAFLRSASHEVGHTFNQIHQEFEGGSDNSIMTTTPSVADVLFTQGKKFPDDINLGFNLTNRHHLVHLPDPAVRPGAMDFFGAAVNAPQADQIFWPAELSVEVVADPSHALLGEPISVTWSLTNNGKEAVLVPSSLDIESLTVRVSSTDARGNTTFMRPAEQKACYHNPLTALNPGEKRTGSATAFWGKDGFLFERPGRYVVAIVIMWQNSSIWVGATGEVYTWVAFPVNDAENRVSALMLHPEVGRAVASPHTQPSEVAVTRLKEAKNVHGDHPAISRLKTLGMDKRLKLS